MSNWDLIHGDSRDVLMTFEDKSFDVCITSPPYFFGKEYEFYKNYDDYLQQMYDVAKAIYRILDDNSLAFININANSKNPLNSFEILKCYLEVGFEFVQEIIWYRRNAQAVRSHKRLTDYKEYIFIFVKNPEKDGYIYPEDCLVETIDPRSKYGRYKPIGNVWDIPVYVGNQFVKTGNTASFPIEIPLNCLKLSRGKRCIDPFVGIGTTILAGIELDIETVGIEINSDYYSRALKNIEKSDISKVWQ